MILQLLRNSSRAARTLSRVLPCCLLGAISANAQSIFDNGALNTISGPSIDVEVRDSADPLPTTLDIVAGAQVGYQLNPDMSLFIDPMTNEPVSSNSDQSVAVFNNSVLNMSDGEIADSIAVHDNATANISGGTIGDDLLGTGNGTVALSGTAFIDDDINDFVGQSFSISGDARINDDATLTVQTFTMTGGRFDDELFLIDTPSATINGGQVDDDINVLGTTVVGIENVQLADSIDLGDSGVANISGGTIEGGVEATGSSIANISAGSFPNVFSDGEEILAAGGQINISGGTFGTAGVEGDGLFGATGTGKLIVSGATIAGADTDTASPAALEASVGGQVSVANVLFNDLSVAAQTGAAVELANISASELAIALQGGDLVMENVNADQFTLSAQLASSVTISGGDLGPGELEIFSDSNVLIRGNDFLINGLALGLGEVPFISGDIQGTLLDGSPFFATFQRQPGSTISLVPEPSGILLACIVGLGWLGLFRSRLGRISG